MAGVLLVRTRKWNDTADAQPPGSQVTVVRLDGRA
jgi:hypothetical protein